MHYSKRYNDRLSYDARAGYRQAQAEGDALAGRLDQAELLYRRVRAALPRSDPTTSRAVCPGRPPVRRRLDADGPACVRIQPRQVFELHGHARVLL